MNINERKAKIMSDYFDKNNVPYKCRTLDDVFIPGHGIQIQFLFGWCNGDVIMDTLSVPDWEENKCVESMGFPWDEENITRIYPEEMAKRITQYYNEIREGE